MKYLTDRDHPLIQAYYNDKERMDMLENGIIIVVGSNVLFPTFSLNLNHKNIAF